MQEFSIGCSRSALSIRNGDVKINGSVAEYSCYSGYRLVNEGKQYCRKLIWFYHWDGRKPWCTRTYSHMSPKLFKALMFLYVKGCSVPIASLNGRVIEKENEAIYLCNQGFSVLGSTNRRTCDTVSGRWRGSTPFCALGKALANK